jgi:hypothetical protein
MKKGLIIFGAIAAMSLASCKKDRTCTCTNAAGSETVTYAKSKKHDVRGACLTTTQTSTPTGGTASPAYTTTCTLK